MSHVLTPTFWWPFVLNDLGSPSAFFSEQRLPTVWGQMGADASNSLKAATPRVCNQTTVVWPVLVSLTTLSPSNRCSLNPDNESPPLYGWLAGGLNSPCPPCFDRDVHAVCLWDDKGPAKIHQALKEDILDFIKQAQAVRLGLVSALLNFLLWVGFVFY